MTITSTKNENNVYLPSSSRIMLRISGVASRTQPVYAQNNFQKEARLWPWFF